MGEIHKVSTGQDIIDMLPMLVGFMPTDSLVLCCLNGSRFGMTARVDSNDTMGIASAVEAVLRKDPDGVIAVAVGSDEDNAQAVDFVSPMLGDKLVKAFTGPNPVAPSAVAMGYAEKLGKNDSMLSRDQIEAEWDHVGGDMPDVTIAERDTFLRAMAESDKIVPSMWLDMARRTAEPSADMYTLAAVSFYLTGDGARAVMGLRKALQIDKNHRLAGLVSSALSAGMDPEIFREGLKS